MQPVPRKINKNRDKSRDYVSNSEFTAAISEWVRLRKIDPSHRMSEYIGQCFMKLVNNYSNKSNFAGYTYIADMRSDAVLHCVKYAHNFNPDKSNNAFAYFTQIIHNAFLQILNKEKGFSLMKFELLKESSDVIRKMDYNDINLNDEDTTSGPVDHIFETIDEVSDEIVVE